MNNKLTPQSYLRVFEANPEGAAILEALCNLFYDRPSYVRGDPYETAYNEGKREAIHYILMRMAQAKQGEQHDDSE